MRLGIKFGPRGDAPESDQPIEPREPVFTPMVPFEPNDPALPWALRLPSSIERPNLTVIQSAIVLAEAELGTAREISHSLGDQEREQAAALAELGSEPVATDFETAAGWQEAIFTWRNKRPQIQAELDRLAGLISTANEDQRNAADRVGTLQTSLARATALDALADLDAAARQLIAAARAYNTATALVPQEQRQGLGIGEVKTALKSLSAARVFGGLERFELVLVAED